MMESMCQKWHGTIRFHRLKVFACSGLVMMTVRLALADPPITTDSPIGFFTNVASRLLSSELNVDLHHIQVYPTNQYTPAVHRLLQVAANIYDATTNRYYDNSQPPMALPTVFRPVFNVVKTEAETNVYVCDFAEVTNANEADAPLSVPWDLSNPAVLANLDPGIHSGASAINVFGAPWIIGAKKGFPNFNELFMENAFQLTRKLLVTRASTNSEFPLNPGDFGFYEMFDLSLSNHFGVEFWNSYRSNYTRPTDVFVNDFMVATLTNYDSGFGCVTNLIVSASAHIDTWPGYNPQANPLAAPFSFQTNFVGLFGNIPTNFAAIPLSMFRFNTPGDVEEPGHAGPYITTNLNLPYETNIAAAGYGPYPQPHWGMVLNNNLQAFMVDTNSGRIIDCVLLSGPEGSRDLFTEIQRWYDTGVSTRYDDLWDTNVTGGLAIPVGIRNQFAISQGNGIPVYSAALWGQDEKSAFDLMNAFRVFIMGQDAFLLFYPGYVPDLAELTIAAFTNQMQMPYTPSALVVQDISWQANDPLVHSTASDLMNSTAGNGLRNYLYWPANLAQVNQRYMPWGGNPQFPGLDTNAYTLAIKDPLVKNPDDWDFPTNQSLGAAWIGRVHRGTPWQTIYLKAPDVLTAFGPNGTNIWINWTGDTNPADAAAMAPVHDWHVAGVLAAMFNTNDLRSLFSVNNPDADAWEGVFDGLTAVTNSSLDNIIQAGSPPEFDPTAISSNSPQAALIADAIEAARTAQSKQLFTGIGKILAVPELTVNSPFLNWSDSVQQQYGISDAAYEVVPSQLLSLLRADSIASVVSANGQMVVQFTGYDGQNYAIEISSDLLNWTRISTNSPTGGVFSITNSAPDAIPHFYRSVLLN